MERLKYFFIGILALSLAGCGQTVVENLKVPENPGYNAPGAGKTVVILPFADYSNGNDIASAHRRNLMVTETLTDRLSANGFSLPVQEDVFHFLVAENIIGLVPYGAQSSSSIENELANGDWSEMMKAQLRQYASQQNTEVDDGPLASPGTHGLTPTTISKIGRTFNADYIVRGRILEFKTREDTGWEPWKRGLLPFINNGAQRVMFGFADSDSYDETNSLLTGGIIGASIGAGADGPWDDQSEILGISGGDTANAILWGSVGAALGKTVHHSRVDQAAVQLRIWVQEAATGNVVYTNRISVKVSPESVLADHQYDVLFNKAIEKGVTTLIDNFVIYTFL